MVWLWLVLIVVLVLLVAGGFLALQAKRRSGGVIIGGPKGRGDRP